jgi:hypothetical protein
MIEQKTQRFKVPTEPGEDFTAIQMAVGDPIPAKLTLFFKLNPEKVRFKHGDTDKIFPADIFYWNMFVIDFVANMFSIDEVFKSTSGPWAHLEEIAGEDFMNDLWREVFNRFGERVLPNIEFEAA